MADISADVTIKESLPRLEGKQVIITTPNTADNADTIAITLSDYGMTTFLGSTAMTHSTEDSVIITEQGTTAVSAGVLTFTIGGSTANKKRTIIIYGE